MTPSELKYHIESIGKERFFFDRKSMKFWGDTMSNFGVRSATVNAQFDKEGNYVKEGVTIEVWELYRKRAVKHGVKSSAYFAKDDFRRIHTIVGD